MYPRYNNTMDTEGLQTDVMRFLAIIALCLVAILALVQRAQPPLENAQTPVVPVVDEPVAQVVAVPQPVPEPVQPPIQVKEALPAKPAKRVVREQPVVVAQRQPAAAALPAPAPAPQVPQPETPAADPDPLLQPLQELDPQPIAQRPARVVAEPERFEFEAPAFAELEPELETESATEFAAVAEVEPDPEPAAAEEQALSLRFASESDFLRLLTKRTVSLYLFNQESALLLGSDLAFAPSAAPNQVYEVLPSTIPAAILRSAQREVAGLQNYAWGVGMPPVIESSIQRWMQRVSTGELLIDRDGEVFHVGTGQADG